MFKNKFHLNTTTVGIGGCRLNDTSNCSYEFQLFIFKCQLKLAAELKLPVVFHNCGINSFEITLRELKLHLNNTHKIHWHCINSKSDLNIISNFLNYFKNSLIGLNGSMTTPYDNDSKRIFNNWLLTQQDILDRIRIEADFPFLRPSTLETNQYNPISGITTGAQHIVNMLRIKKLNATKIIDRSNNNMRRMYGIN
ncbi:unnamed protein product [Rotaria sordida]|uniref:Uncharacterized protein n=1 Tax=Rotaria sordida TaxID=392033 RepID=A0A814FWR6_9BILA|nr:unnamed protein product [Rotaria sordida]CAF0990489.1 unnamed protein product [Rotaria sordida]